MSKDNRMQQELYNKKLEERTAEYRKKVEAERQLARATQQDKFAKERISYHDQKGNEVTYWQDTEEKAKQLIHSEANSYHDWRACMMALLSIYGALTNAIAQSVKETAVTYPLDLLSNKASDLFNNKIKPKLTGNPEIDLPALQHDVGFSDDNKLQIAPLIRSDNIPDKGKLLDNLFKVGVVKWLQETGYTPQNAEKTIFADENGVQLTKSSFDTLKNDPDKGLNHFLTEYSDLTFNPTPTPI